MYSSASTTLRAFWTTHRPVPDSYRPFHLELQARRISPPYVEHRSVLYVLCPEAMFVKSAVARGYIELWQHDDDAPLFSPLARCVLQSPALLASGNSIDALIVSMSKYATFSGASASRSTGETRDMPHRTSTSQCDALASTTVAPLTLAHPEGVRLRSSKNLVVGSTLSTRTARTDRASHGGRAQRTTISTNLQKAIRRRHVAIAARTALELARIDMCTLARRLVIIAVEDVRPNAHLPVCTWIMVGLTTKHYMACERDVVWLVQYAQALATDDGLLAPGKGAVAPSRWSVASERKLLNICTLPPE